MNTQDYYFRRHVSAWKNSKVSLSPAMRCTLLDMAHEVLRELCLASFHGPSRVPLSHTTARTLPLHWFLFFPPSYQLSHGCPQKSSLMLSQGQMPCPVCLWLLLCSLYLHLPPGALTYLMTCDASWTWILWGQCSCLIHWRCTCMHGLGKWNGDGKKGEQCSEPLHGW